MSYTKVDAQCDKLATVIGSSPIAGGGPVCTSRSLNFDLSFFVNTSSMKKSSRRWTLPIVVNRAGGASLCKAHARMDKFRRKQAEKVLIRP